MAAAGAATSRTMRMTATMRTRTVIQASVVTGSLGAMLAVGAGAILPGVDQVLDSARC
jgi:hypothetical protein